MKLDNYQYTGIGLISFGVPFALYCYFVLLNVPFAVLGLSCIVLGGTLLLVPPGPLPALEVRAMLEGSLVNIEALLEEFDVMGKAVYISGEERVHAFIPIAEREVKVGKIPLRVLTSAGDEPGVIVFPPGSEVVRLALLPEDIGFEDALSLVLVDFVELVDGVRAVSELDQVIVELDNPRAWSDMPRVNRSLGSLPVSVAGCVLASVLGKGVVLRREEQGDGMVSAVFGVMD